MSSVQAAFSTTLPKTGRVATDSKARAGPTPSSAAMISAVSSPTKHTSSRPRNPSTADWETRNPSTTTKPRSSNASQRQSGRSRLESVRRRTAQRAMSWRSRRRYKLSTYECSSKGQVSRRATNAVQLKERRRDDVAEGYSYL